MDDCYTSNLHDPASENDLTIRDGSGKRSSGCYASSLHIVRCHLVRRGGRIYYRRRVPEALRATIGKREVWRSLGTDSPTVARRRSHDVAATIERDFEEARARAGLGVDQRILERLVQGASLKRESDRKEGVPVKPVEAAPGITLRELYDAYMSDPTRDWAPRTRLSYETTRRLVLAIVGEKTPVRSITRAHCRNLIETLRWLPRNALTRYPRLTPVEIAARAKEAERTDLMSPSNINTYLNKVGGVFNWAVKEEMMDRNPAKGLKVPDATLRRDKRLPFSNAQLQAIFTAPLYTGCRDDGHGYAAQGDCRPRNARFWIPLISLFNGLRLNEACQLDVADVRLIEDTPCFVLTEASEGSACDKRLKTASSARVVPIHPELVALRFLEFVAARRRANEVKLFGEVGLGATGYRSTTFSAWFTRFTGKARARSSKTCFHSFRHNFRDALREARIEREIALTLGGWSTTPGSGTAASVADAYGNGYRIATLLQAISLVCYPHLDLTHLR